MSSDAKRNYVEVTIRSGETTSTIADLQGFVLSGIDFPEMTSANVTLNGANPGTGNNPYAAPLMKPLSDWLDVNLMITVSSTAKIRLLPPSAFAGVRFLQIVAASPEGADRVIRFIGYEA